MPLAFVREIHRWPVYMVDFTSPGRLYAKCKQKSCWCERNARFIFTLYSIRKIKSITTNVVLEIEPTIAIKYSLLQHFWHVSSFRWPYRITTEYFFCPLQTHVKWQTRVVAIWKAKSNFKQRTIHPGGRLNKKDGLTRYGNSHVKDKTS